MTNKFSLSLIGIGATLLFLAGCAPTLPQPNGQTSSPSASSAGLERVLLFFYSQGDLDNALFDHPITVTRDVPEGSVAAVADAALKLLFAGPTKEEKADGARTSADLATVGLQYLGTTVENGVALVNFREEALSILNAAAARQFMAKEPIRRTLLQFPEITDVTYAIDGELFDEWDA